MVDVGQGDSIFLRSMKGDTILIDVGGKVTFGSKENGKRLVRRAMRRKP